MLGAVMSALLLAGCGGSAAGNASQAGNTPPAPPSSQSSTAGQSSAVKPVHIDIGQYVEHPSLDAAVAGFKDALKAAGYVERETVFYNQKNAQGATDLTASVAQSFAQDNADLILAVATPMAQAVAKVVKDRPVLITAVTDPVSAGLVKSLDHPGGNVSGTTDLNPVAEQIGLIPQIKPGAKRVGILYNSGEANSLVQVKLARQAAQQNGLTLVEATVTQAGEVAQAAQSLVGRVDAIYVPTDNTVVAALDAVIKVANQNKIPIVSGEGDSVKKGCVATYGIDYHQLGEQTGQMAVEILQGKAKPADLAIRGGEPQLILNQAAAEAQGAVLPEKLLSKAKQVYR
ncbi:MAG: ABC transporter substrate-binding protein [Firmicutes bacterium]|nr:ABC transporter substrate-binding protein [Bacillota bacterium]